MLKKGQQVELKIDSLAPGGEGISKNLDVPVFISKTAPGDLVLAEIFDYRRSFAKGQILKVLTPGPERVEPECKLFKVCGGCQWMHIGYKAQLEYKKDLIEQSLRHMGGRLIGEELCKVLEPVIGAEEKFGYRNKVQMPVRNPKDSTRLLAGYFETNSHNLVNIKHCPIQPTVLDDILAKIKELTEENKISAYDEKTTKGLLRHIHMRINQKQDSILVTLVLNCSKIKLPVAIGKIASSLMASFPEIKGFCVNFNEQKGNRILGDKTACIAGQSYIEEILSTNKNDLPESLRRGIKFRLSPESFFQVNTKQAIRLLEVIAAEVKNFVGHNLGREIVLLDAYAGVGTIALWLAPLVAKVQAVESNAQAVKDGEFNKDLNGMDNVQFELKKVEEFLPGLLETEKKKPDIVVLDPPRQGLNPEVIRTIMKLKPELIIYVSCNPVTLARDLRLMLNDQDIEDNIANAEVKKDCFESDNGYKVEKIVPVDLFPQTYHVESVSVLRRQ